MHRPDTSEVPDEISVGPDGEILGRYNIEGTEWTHDDPILFPNEVDLAIFQFPDKEKTQWIGLVFTQTVKGDSLKISIALSPILAKGISEDIIKIVEEMEEEKT